MRRAALFDLDGTLVNSDDAVVWAVETLLSKHGFPDVPHEDIIRRIGVGLKPLLAAFVKDPDNYVDEYRTIYSKGFRSRTYVYEGVIETLAELKNRNVKTAIVTNRNRDLTESIINHFRISGYIDKLVAHTGEKPLKPAPDMVYEVLDAFGTGPGESAMVGDTEIDVDTGKNAGLFTIKVDYMEADGETKADIVVTSFPDILDHFS